tara:strand:+ start:1107 stop:1364 length:258 start_codon:yes stop_codon:yes gene_type:complete
MNEIEIWKKQLETKERKDMNERIIYDKNIDQEKEDLHDHLLEYGYATEEEISLVTSIMGYNLEALEGILYSRTGYRTLEQIRDYE